ncbi:MAG: peptide chain release factor-like protein [Phycisphaera sp.]|nr:MAG: peptide chain release factor-like protein [Phycisphaera sp.]
MSTHPLIDPIFVSSPHPATLDDEAILKACDLGRGRSSGPGGQHRNRVQTLVMLTHKPTGVEAHAGERRSAQDNKRVALKRLRFQLALQTRAPVPPGDIGSAMWKSRIKAGKIACNVDHHDYPAMVAEAIDVIYDASFDMKRAAVRLDCTQSQLIKLLAKEPAALVALNEARKAKGMGTLRG